MSSNVRQFPTVLPPQQLSPAQQGWMWDGVNWTCDPCNQPMPPPCPPPGWPTPCPPWFPPPAAQAPWYPGANGGVSFSSSPPPNPVRGHFWWDGSVLHLFDGAAWVDIGPSPAGSGGAFVSTTPPANPSSGALWWNGVVLQVWDGTKWSASAGTAFEFAITMPTPATVGTTATAWTAVAITGTPVVDVQSAWNPATLRYTPKVAGFYQFQGRSFNGGQTAGLSIVKNDPGSFSGATTDTVVSITSDVDAGALSAVGIAQMNGTTDYVRLWAYNAAGTLPAAGANVVLGAYKLP